MSDRFKSFILSKSEKIRKPYNRIKTLFYIPVLLKFIWETNTYYSLTVVTLRFFRSFLPILILFISKLIIDKLISIKAGTSSVNELWPIVALEVIIVSINEVSTRLSTLVESLLGDLLSNQTIIRLMEQTTKLDLSHFENPEFYDKLERAKRHLYVRIIVLTNLLTLIQDSLILISIAISTLFYNIWLFILLFISIFPSLLNATHFASLEYSMLFRWTKEQRLLEYLMDLTTSDKTAKEIQSFGLGTWLVERFKNLSKKFYQENKQLAIRKNITAIIFTVIGIIGYYLAFIFILKQTLAGVISLGTMTFLSLCFLRSRENLYRLLMSASEIYTQSLYLKDLFEFLEIKPSIIFDSTGLKVSQPMTEGFVFENVSFRYPGTNDWAVYKLNFYIKPGEAVALVGENGAGKTTIIKLLLRLYDPTEGKILLDGKDLRDYDLSSLRNNISTIFQDFLHYDMSFDENIAVGNIDLAKPHLENNSSDSLAKNIFLTRLNSAIEESLANTVLDHLPNKHSQILGRHFEEGIDLSGGEWQKIAIARLHMRNAQMLILDEPTSALDVRAEYEISKRFTKIMANRMAIIISHRFSTIRMANRIIVLQKGTVVEEGTHNELVNCSGLYAELFNIQSLYS